MSIGPNPTADDLAVEDEEVEGEGEEETTEDPSGTEGSESVAEEGEGDDQFTNFDINQVPEEYREHVAALQKQLQGDYTRKTQSLAEVRRDLEASRETVETAREMVNSPEMERFIQLRNAGKLSGDTEATDELNELRESADPDVAKFIEAAVEQGVAKRTASLQKQLAKVNAVIFAAQNPDWQEYHDDIQKHMRATPGMTLEEAYEKAKAPALRADVSSMRKTIRELQTRLKKEGSTEKPGPSKVPKKAKAATSWDEAVALAREQHGEPTADDTLFGG